MNFEYRSPEDIGIHHMQHPEWFRFSRREPDHLRRIPWQRKEVKRPADKVVVALFIAGWIFFLLYF